MTDYKRPESVLVVIFDDQGRILALQRKDDLSFWQSVTGSLEEGEVPIEAAIREVLEETSIDCQALNLTMVDARQTNQYEIRPEWRHRYAPGEFVNTEYTFLLQVPSGIDVVLTEHEQFSWLSPQDAVELFWSPSNCAAIQRYFLSERRISG